VSLEANTIAYFGSPVTDAPTPVAVSCGNVPGGYNVGGSITVDSNGFVWFKRTNGSTIRLCYQNLAGTTNGNVQITGTVASSPVLVATTQASTCYVYAQTSNTTMSQVNCADRSTVTAVTLGTTCQSAMSGGVAAANGDVYFLGRNAASTSQGTICKVVGTVVTNVVADGGALYTGLAFDADGYLWTSRGTSLIRYQVTPSVVATTVVGTQIPTNVVFGAGALWGPSSGGTNLSNLTRVVP
jgi:hypothetical protein